MISGISHVGDCANPTSGKSSVKKMEQLRIRLNMIPCFLSNIVLLRLMTNEGRRTGFLVAQRNHLKPHFDLLASTMNAAKSSN